MFREKRQYGQDPESVVRSKTTFFAPLKWKEPSEVFTCSWSDWLIEEADAWRDEAYGVIRATPHSYQILTKRIERADGRVPSDLPNVALGVSVENRRFTSRIAILRSVDVALRFVSIEPLLEDVGDLDLTGIGWGIVGGESGFRRRDMPLPAFERVVAQFREQGVPLFVKQDSAFKSGQQGRIPDALFRQERMPLLGVRA
jgi:protein gp37